MVRVLLDHGASAEAQDKEGLTPVDLAICGGHQLTVELLLQGGGRFRPEALRWGRPLLFGVRDPALLKLLVAHGVDLQIRDSDGRALTHLGNSMHTEDYIDETWLSCLRFLLDQGVPRDARAKTGSTPLHEAAYWSAINGTCRAYVRLLVERGADVNAINDNGDTPLHLAVARPELVTFLLDHGADPTRRGKFGRSPLAQAAFGPPESVRILLDRGVPPDGEALENAAGQGSTESVRLLLDRGAAVDGSRAQRWTPLYLARLNKKSDTAQLLQSRGGHLMRVGAGSGNQALVEFAQQDDLESVGQLLELGVDPNLAGEDEKRTTPLIAAAISPDGTAVAAFLLKHGARINGGDGKGRSPLIWSAIRGRDGMVAWLLDHGADAEARDVEGYRALDYAAGLSLSCCQILLDRGSPFDTPAVGSGETPLHQAAFTLNLESARLLLAKGASPKARTVSGETPADAARRTHPEAREKGQLEEMLRLLEGAKSAP
jgi:cytohesin